MKKYCVVTLPVDPLVSRVKSVVLLDLAVCVAWP